MAKSVTKTANASTAYGEPVSSYNLKDENGNILDVVSFTYDYPELENSGEIPEDEKPTEKQILGLVNSLRNATARNKAQSIAFEKAGIKAPTVDPAESRRKTLVKVLMAEGATAEIAEKMADTMLATFRG